MEACFLIGPGLVAALGAAGSVAAVLWIDAGPAVVGAVLFGRPGPGRIPSATQPRGASRAPWQVMGRLWVVLTVIAAFGVADGLVQVAVPLSSEVAASASTAGVMFVAMSLGSLTSALARVRRSPRQPLMLQLAVATVLLGLAQIGLGVAPSATIMGWECSWPGSASDRSVPSMPDSFSNDRRPDQWEPASDGSTPGW